MNENFDYCHVVGKTDTGMVRKANEDSMLNAITPNGLVSVVCDGMGGHVGGATASRIAVNTVIENLKSNYYPDPRVAIAESIDKANKAVLQKTMEQPELQGMGSTCVLLIVRQGKVYIGHVGDSRIYLVRSRRIVQLTKDHSYVQMLVDCGEITHEQAERHPRKNEITNALGLPDMAPATLCEDAFVPEAGDCFVLCSDGLSGMVSDDTICRIVSRQAEMTAQARADKLVETANANGGKDNITVQLVEFSVTPGAAATNECSKKPMPKWVQVAAIATGCIALGIGSFFLISTLSGKSADKESTAEVAENAVDMRQLGEVAFAEHAEVAELVYTDSAVVIKRAGQTLDTLKGQFDANKALEIVTKDNAVAKYSNRLVAFAEQMTADSVEFRLSETEGKKAYVCRVKVTKPEAPALPTPPAIQLTPLNKEAAEKANK